MIQAPPINATHETQSLPRKSTRGSWTPPAPSRPRIVRCRNIVAIHDVSLTGDFVATPVHCFEVDQRGGYHPIGVRRGNMARLDEHSSRFGFFCGVLESGRDPQEAAVNCELSLHDLTRQLLHDRVGYSRSVYAEALADLDRRANAEERR